MKWRCGEYGWRLWPGSGVALGLAMLLKLGFFQPFEQVAYDSLFRWRGERPWDDRLVLIAIDDRSLQKLGRFPWSRQRYVQLLDQLTAAPPTVVAFDLLWSEPTPDDAALALALTRSGRVVLAQAWDNLGLPLRPVRPLEAAAIGTGHILTPTDSDGLTRKIDQYLQGQPSLGLAAVQAYSLIKAPVSASNPPPPLWINWVSSARHLTRYSFTDVLEGKVPAAALRNKIVLVGVTASGIDPLLTPFEQNPPASGVHLQATIINNLLQQNGLQPLDPAWHWLILLGGPGLSWLLSSRRTLEQVAIAVGLSCGWLGLSGLLLLHNQWLPIALPLGLVVVTTITVALTERLRLNRLLQRQLQQLWQLHQPDLDSLILDSRQPPALAPARQLTALAQQLSRSQSTQAAIARSLSIGLVAADRAGLVWFCNPVAANWLAVKVGDQLASLMPQWFSLIDWQQNLAALYADQAVEPTALRSGDRWLEIKLELLYDRQFTDAVPAEPPLEGLLVLIEDITAKKQIELTIDQQIQELQRIDRLKDEFLSTVSHELRTPLTNIKLSVELLKIATSEEKRLHYLKILENECLRETNLINDLLDLQRLEAGTPISDLSLITLLDWLPLIVEPFYRRTEARQQTLTLQIAADIPSFQSDEAGLERILVELINNACKYTPPLGEIRITAQQQAPWLEIGVRNSGVEIADHEFSRIFDRFYRIPASDLSKQGGTGLGLALVKKLVERLGGIIHVSSGSGYTSFIVQLPLPDQPIAAAPPPAERP
jgi:signal transduction histidine kinase/CHASE2 domain-containing sensor protein